MQAQQRAGRAKSFQENAAMLPFLYTETRTPIVHVQTMFADSWRTVAHVPEASHTAMSAQERGDVRLKAAQRLNTAFQLEWSPYFPSALGEDRAGVPEWVGHAKLNAPLTKQPPWVAAWNRTVRKMVRLKLKDTERQEDVQGDSPLSELFYSLTAQAPLMSRAAFEAWANQSGYTTSAINWLSKQMTRLAQVARPLLALALLQDACAALCCPYPILLSGRSGPRVVAGKWFAACRPR
jgi:hypothetical protein